MRSRVLSFVSAGALLVGLSACGGSQQPAPPPTTRPAAPATTSAPAPAPAGEFGVAECDAFFTKYFACIDGKVPEAARAAVKTAAEQTKTQLQQAAQQPGGQEGLVMVCTQAQDAAKQAMQAYGCEW